MINEAAAKRIAQIAECFDDFGAICSALADVKDIDKRLPRIKLAFMDLARDAEIYAGLGHASKETRAMASDILMNKAMAISHPNTGELVNNPKKYSWRRIPGYSIHFKMCKIAGYQLIVGIDEIGNFWAINRNGSALTHGRSENEKDAKSQSENWLENNLSKKNPKHKHGDTDKLKSAVKKIVAKKNPGKFSDLKKNPSNNTKYPTIHIGGSAK